MAIFTNHRAALEILRVARQGKPDRRVIKRSRASLIQARWQPGIWGMAILTGGSEHAHVNLRFSVAINAITPQA